MDFKSALRDLVREGNLLNRDLIAVLSSPTRAEREAFATCWCQIGEARKCEIISRMVELAEERFELDYAALFRHCLGDANATVRRYAIEGLWEDESADLVEPLLRLLSTDPDPGVRAAAATSVGRFLFQAECDELDERHGALIRQALERAIDDPGENVEVIRRAVESIAYINDDSVRRIIDRAYDHSDRRMRESAIFAMGRSADPFWADTVLAELYSDSPAIRYEAARACGELELGPAVGRLIDLVADPEREVQSMAVWALGQIGGDRSRTILERLAESEDELLSGTASEALDELRFLTRPLDLLVHTVEDGCLTGIEFAPSDEECEAADYGGHGRDEDGREDNSIDLS